MDQSLEPIRPNELGTLLDGSVGEIHSNGYLWFRDVFVTAVDRLASNEDEYFNLLNNALLALGDIHSINGAPRAALKAYQRAVKLNPNCEEAHSEIANCAYDLGNELLARHHIKQAIRLAPHDAKLHDRAKEYRDLENFHSDVLMYQVGDPIWETQELLAAFLPDQALIGLNNQESAEADRARLHCFGAMQDADTYLLNLADQLRRSDEWCFDYADWFFVPHGMIDQSRLWEVYLDSATRYSGVFSYPDDLMAPNRGSTEEVIRIVMNRFLEEARADNR